MKEIEHNLGLGGTNDGSNILQGGFLEALDALEGNQQLLLGLRAYALDVVQNGMHLGLAAFLAMEGNGEPMHFVLNMFQEMKEIGFLLELLGEDILY